MNSFFLRIFLTIGAMALLQVAQAQLRMATYRIDIDTIVHFAEGRLYSTLTFNKDSSYKYNYLNSASCLLSFKCAGTWKVKSDTLVLSDSKMRSASGGKDCALGTILFRVEKDRLKYLSRSGGTESGWTLFANFRLKKKDQ